MTRPPTPPGCRRLTMFPWPRRRPWPGEYLRARPRGRGRSRRAYLIIAAWPRGGEQGGWVLDVEPMSAERVPEDATVRWFVWHPRGRR